MSEKIQFQTNIPVEVALKYADGKDVTGEYGDQVLYSLTDGRVMYVPPIVKKQIQRMCCKPTTAGLVGLDLHETEPASGLQRTPF